MLMTRPQGITDGVMGLFLRDTHKYLNGLSVG
jgi:hypothetical protein